MRKLITVEFVLFVKTQFITNSQNILHLNQWAQICTCLWTVILSQVPVHLRMAWQVSKVHRWYASSFFLVGADYTRSVVSIVENMKDWGWVNMGAVPKKNCLWPSHPLPPFHVGTNSRNLSKYLRYTLSKQDLDSFASPVNSSIPMMLLCLIWW
jgi:hypothetical protein